MRSCRTTWVWPLALALAACSDVATLGLVAVETETTVGSGDDDVGTAGPDSLDLPTDGPLAQCIARGNDAGVGLCLQEAAAPTFEPSIEWSWNGEGDEVDVFSTALVANLTDDDDNGRIDLCDTPDVLVIAAERAVVSLRTESPVGHLYVLDGAEGTSRARFDTPVRPTYTPAIGDLDRDGVPDIVAVAPAATPDVAPFSSRVVAFAADGTVRWTGEETFDTAWAGAVALADLDGDEDVEIMVSNRVLDHDGRTRFVATEVEARGPSDVLPFAVDLDGDEDLEVLWGTAAYHHDGTPVFAHLPEVLGSGYPHVVQLDDDPAPEILVTTEDGVALLEADGTIRFVNSRIDEVAAMGWRRPAAIHDFSQDGLPEIAMSAGDEFVVFTIDLANNRVAERWTAPIFDPGGAAAGTAFDFLGDAGAEAMYADRTELFIYDELGAVVLQAARASETVHEYPVVADVDNDGSAEIVVVSNSGASATEAPAVRVFGEANSRWVQARRIWNQHAYHVTNVLEDATIPFPQRSVWLRLNTFRTNAQIEGGVVCKPEP